VDLGVSEMTNKIDYLKTASSKAKLLINL
jgi:hypothetical protein